MMCLLVMCALACAAAGQPLRGARAESGTAVADGSAAVAAVAEANSSFTSFTSFSNKYELQHAVAAWCGPQASVKDEILKKYGDISAWQVGAVTDMSSVFAGQPCDPDLHEWDMSRVVNTRYMFNNAIAFTGKGDLSHWATGFDDMRDMFAGATAFTAQLCWDVSADCRVDSAFENTGGAGWNCSAQCSKSNAKCTVSPTTKAPTRAPTRTPTSTKPPIEALTDSNIHDAAELWCQNPTLATEQYGSHISNWDTSRVTNMGRLFATFTVNSSGWLNDYCIGFNDDIGAWNTASVTNMTAMFAWVGAFNQAIGKWDTAKVTSMKGMFFNADQFDQAIGAWSTAAVTDMSLMFYGASAFNQDLAAWSTSAVQDMGYLFAGASAFNHRVGAWDTANVTDMQHVFDSAIEFNQDISAWSTSKVTDMSNMFMNARKFNQNAIGKWDTAKVAYMGYMFDQAIAFEGKICWPHNDTVPTHESMWTGSKVGDWTCP